MLTIKNERSLNVHFLYDGFESRRHCFLYASITGMTSGLFAVF